ncbi:hypothetical protein [Haloferula sp. BvORR071]|uniref:hypothetical protein n=1 Tax=Haloferula sp. BvORR071 TaxID=1396141 RepID=UPI00055648D7|nr:hypothetical protein [Haloferula sp. BvORR071]
MISRRLVHITALLVMLAGGALRLPLEARLTAKFRDQGLLAKPIDIDLREKIGQEKWSVALAGLRTLVAGFSALRATEQFHNTDWPGLAESVNTTVELAPKTEFYWDIGGWHMAYNAASSYRYDKDQDRSKLWREAKARAWVEKGREFYHRGVRNNPGDPKLAMLLGDLYSDLFRFPDDAEALKAYRQAEATGKAPPQVKRRILQARARLGEDPATLLPDLKKLFIEDPTSRVPTLLCLAYVLEAQLSPPDDYLARAVQIFGSEKRAWQLLGTYFGNVGDRMPMTAVEPAVRLLERKAGISPDDRESYIHEREKNEMIARSRRLGR